MANATTGAAILDARAASRRDALDGVRGNGHDQEPPDYFTERLPDDHPEIISMGKAARTDKTPRGDSSGASLIEQSFWACDAKVTTSLPYVVKGIIGQGQLIVLWGQPGSGKSFLTTELLLTVAAGMKWHGRRTRRGVCIYVVAESSRPFIENRIAALRREKPELADAEVLVVPLALDLLNAEKGDVDRVIEAAKLVSADRGEVLLIAIDTLATTFHGGDENGPDMGRYVANIKRIIAETGAGALIVHHCGKDQAKGMRGHTALLGAIDAELTVEGEPGGERFLKTQKVRDGDAYADLFAFTLRRVELGTDQDGDAVSTCVIDAMTEDATRQARQRRKRGGIGKHQKTVMRVLEQAGGCMPRIDLAYKLKEEENVPRQRVSDSINSLLENGMLIANSNVDPPTITLP